jgi:SAM-dependent methyltransferase
MTSSLQSILSAKSSTYDLQYKSSACEPTIAVLGTIEKDSCGHFGKHLKEKFRGKQIFDIFVKKDFDTVLDIGPGKLEAVEEFLNNGKTVDICEFEEGLYYNESTLEKDMINEIHIGDFNTLEFNKRFDAVWCAHVLEHQLNPNIFLKKLNSIVKKDGYLAIVVPPRKPIIVGGHVSIWNAGLLLYHLVLAGFDCSNAQVLQYDYNIGIILKVRKITLPNINYDAGDLILLKDYLPFDLQSDSFNGDITSLNLDNE